MELKLRQHMDELFSDVPTNRQSVEIKEEILQNITDKYHDLLSEGKSEEAAYNIAIASIGDLDELLESLRGTNPPINDADVSAYQEWKKKSSVRTAIAVMLYILSVVPPIIIDSLSHSERYDFLGAVGLFLFIAAATGILVYNRNSKPLDPTATITDGSVAKDFKKWQESKNNRERAFKDVTRAAWGIILVLYFVISFVTGAWQITWILFLLGIAIKSIIRAIFTLNERSE